MQYRRQFTSSLRLTWQYMYIERCFVHSSLNQRHIFAMSSPNAHHEIAQTRYSILQQRAQAFCAAFLDLANNLPDKILSEHFTPGSPKITEHGPGWYT